MHALYDIELMKMLAPNQHQESSGESRIDKMRKFLSSPLMRKKPSVLHLKTFGTPLDILLQKTPSDHSVPFIITRLCQYIQKTGLTHEGLFRISGNARSVERLRVSFDRSGDAPLETEGDVPSAAALLKLFLRELPDPIIPLAMHCQFLEAVKDKDRSESIPCLSELVEKLPAINYNILSYLSCFLKQVSEMEEQNRMSASSLGIVFGPNLFRVTEDFVGLKEQSLTNQIVTYFITDYEDIFKKEIGDIFPSSCLSQSMINSSNHQVTSMVSSWPETKERSASKLSTWSLGPISAQMAAVNDSYLPLCASTSYVEEEKVQMLSSEQEEVIFATVNHFNSSEQESIIEFSSISPDNVSFEIRATSSPVLSQSFEKKCTNFAKDSGFQEGSIDIEQSFSHFSITDTNTQAESSSSHVDTDRKQSLSINGRNHHSQENSIIIQKEITHQSEVSSPKTSSEKYSASHETPEHMKETHKSYPRGRRRHVRHHKNKELAFDERRSRSELRSGSHHATEDCNGNDSMLSETSKNELQYSSTGTLDESSSDLRHSWPAFRKAHEDAIALSPLPQQLGMNQCSEASVSPSAFRSYLSHRNLHLDPSLPPSPPVEQEDMVVGGSHEAPTSNAKQLSRKVHALKKKIKLFEENFEKLYGYKPSHVEKHNNVAMKKMLCELNKAKLDLKQLKDESSLWNLDDGAQTKSSRGTNTKSSQALFAVGTSPNMTIEDSIKESLEYLSRHRKEGKRSEVLEEMNREQLVAEKVAIQKVLLNFENMHGRPASKAHRELVRPLYDRYRNTKRLIARMSSSKDNAELQPIPENAAMDFKAAEQSETSVEKPSHESVEEIKHNHCSAKEEASLKLLSPHINFHELSVAELTEEIEVIREEKRKLRKALRDFEDKFKKENGRKAQREDKRAMESHYTQYKNTKAKLKLLEALVAKHEQAS